VERFFFMLIPEACQLLLQSAAISDDGEVMALHAGEQLRNSSTRSKLASRQRTQRCPVSVPLIDTGWVRRISHCSHDESAE
jgi:FlaA1/EpsC-like NDP-sugar epimerase